MSKVTRPRLARGTKLVPEHVHGVLEDIRDEINASTIDREQMATPDGIVRLALPITHIDSGFFTLPGVSGAPGYRPFIIPFCLPPLQESFNVTAGRFTIDEDTPRLVLEEVHFSFDQRDEPAAIADGYHNSASGQSADKGLLDFDNVLTAYNFALSIVEKQQDFFVDGLRKPEKEVFSIELPGDAFIGEHFRSNPFVIEDINRIMHPYATYAFLLHCDGLSAETEHPETHALVSVNVELVFRHPLVARDTGTVQNIPTKHSGAKTARTVTISSPTPGDDIAADTADGVSEAIYQIDTVFQQKLSGGYDEFGESAPLQELAHDACYDILAVPMWQGRQRGGIISDKVLEEPWVTVAKQTLGCQVFIPIVFPFVIHHVVLAYNWMQFTPDNVLLASKIATSATFTVETGVAIGRGLRSDGVGYEDVATLTLVNPLAAGWKASLIDRIKIHEFSAVAAAGEGYDWELHSVPILTAGGVGYYAQGEPFWAGKAWTPTALTYDGPGAPVIDRAGVDGNGGGVARTKGEEQFLQVRMHITDSGAALETPVGDIYMGYAGCWVFIYGKKMLA